LVVYIFLKVINSWVIYIEHIRSDNQQASRLLETKSLRCDPQAKCSLWTWVHISGCQTSGSTQGSPSLLYNKWGGGGWTPRWTRVLASLDVGPGYIRPLKRRKTKPAFVFSVASPNFTRFFVFLDKVPAIPKQHVHREPGNIWPGHDDYSGKFSS
jgi:hypothetical protein